MFFSRIKPFYGTTKSNKQKEEIDLPLQNKLHFSRALFKLNDYTNPTSHPTCIMCTPPKCTCYTQISHYLKIFINDIN